MIEARGLTRTFKVRSSQAGKAGKAGQPGAVSGAGATASASAGATAGASAGATAGAPGVVEAVRGVDLDVTAGEIVGLLGPGQHVRELSDVGDVTAGEIVGLLGPGDRVTFEVEDAAHAARVLAAAPEARDATPVWRGLRVTVDRGETQALPLLRRLDAAGVRVSALHVAHPTLDDAFLALTGRSLRGDA